MGLDAVELVMDIEETFAITIPDNEASRIRTVGDLHDLIVAKATVANNSTVCLSANTFYTLRRAATTLGVTERLRPRDRLTHLLPDTNRRKFWNQLAEAAQLKLPELRRPQWVVLGASLVVVLFSISVALAVFVVTESQIATTFSALIASFASSLRLAVLSKPFANQPSAHIATLRDLAEIVLARNFKLLSDRHAGAHANDVWLVLRGLIVEQLGVSPEMVTPTASLVKDLGCD